MGLDIHLEADERLSIAAVSATLSELGALDISSDQTAVSGFFESGLAVSAECELDNHTLYAEDTKGMNFPVAIRCYLRISGPEPEDLSALADLENFVKHVSTKTEANFVVSFQYESVLYWNDNSGLNAT